MRGLHRRLGRVCPHAYERQPLFMYFWVTQEVNVPATSPLGLPPPSNLFLLFFLLRGGGDLIPSHLPSTLHGCEGKWQQ